MNCLALRYDDDIIVIDAGMMFPDAELMGVDVVIPDLTYLVENREKVRALILTHGHEDHIGGVPFFLRQINVPVYGTALTLALVERRLEEHDLSFEPELHEVKPGDEIEAGPFTVECIHVTHSITSSLALGIRTPLGLIVHTGDFKIDQTPMDDMPFDLHKFAEYGREGVLLLLSDSTNVDRPGFTESERAVRPRLEDLFRRADGRLVISCFSSSIHRMQHILDLAKENGRKVAFLGRSMVSVSEIAHSLGLLHIPDNILLRPQDIMQAPADKVCVVISGTQGEPMSAMARVAVDNHKHLAIRPRDMVVLSARIIPGNEKPIYRMINHLARRGSEVVYGSMNPPVHVSGHASVEELKLILALVKPQYFMPVHGEYRQLVKHAKLASDVVGAHIDDSFVIESGETLVIDKRGAKKGEPVTVGRICIDSGSVDEVVEDMVIRDRRHLSEDGFVLPIIAINKHTGKSETLPEIVSRGFKSLEDASDLMKEARQVVARTLENSSAEERTDWGVMQEKIRTDLRRFINKQTSRRPLIMPVILEV